jgi:hypothetical protein
MTPMAAKRGRKFDLKTFLSTIDGGRKIVTVPRKQTLFSQGDSSDAVFYIQKGKVRLTVVSKTGTRVLRRYSRKVVRERMSEWIGYRGHKAMNTSPKCDIVAQQGRSQPVRAIP